MNTIPLEVSNKVSLNYLSQLYNVRDKCQVICIATTDEIATVLDSRRAVIDLLSYFLWLWLTSPRTLMKNGY
jgi:hypothetical protein